jgi:FlaA1/EpsC-like NDP-sugar epimerase
VPCLVDIKDYDGLSQIFHQYSPEIVFHAAAYKHVHLVESNPHTSILNNILGTKNLLKLSEKLNVEKFVLISSDKAVNPAGVMGSTKRICEVLTSLAGFTTNRSYSAVRFGNVLGSSGSLVPLLKKQIEGGFPLTITHKDITRYFMLIDEAVSLVLKAASISKPGDINVLRMGEPIKIIDVAKNLVRLMGKNEDEVEYQYTGLRPGEKMFEELYISGNELETEHPDILVVPKGDALPKDFREVDFVRDVDNMLEAAKRGDKNAIFVLSKLVNSNYEHPTFLGQLMNVKSSE